MSAEQACSRALKQLNIGSASGSSASKPPVNTATSKPSASVPVNTATSKPSASVAQRYNALLTQAKQFEKSGDASRAAAAYEEAHGVYGGDVKLQAKIAKLRLASAADAVAAAPSRAHAASAAPASNDDDDDAPLVAAPPLLQQPPAPSSSSSSTTTTTTTTIPLPPVAVPPHLWSCLFPYQRTGITWMHELFTRGHGGILGDDMGLGKTSPLPPLSSPCSATKS
jgi:hypothetical protein